MPVRNDVPRPLQPAFPVPHDPLVDAHDFAHAGEVQGGDVQESDDIYRGQPVHVQRPPSPVLSVSSASSSSSSTSSTSSSSSDSHSSDVIGRSLGGIAAVVEHAIARWARTHSFVGSSSSSSTSSSSSDDESIRTAAKSFISRRRRPRPSLASLRNAQSERLVAARIKAREELRHVPREFVFYVPRSLGGVDSALSAATDVGLPGPGSGKHPAAPTVQRVSRTTALPIALNQLDSALKKSMRAHRVQARARAAGKSPAGSVRTPQPQYPPPVFHHDYMLPESARASSGGSPFGDYFSPRPSPAGAKHRKGKSKESAGKQTPVDSVSSRARASPYTEIGAGLNRQPSAWWLDVASPTWEDMRAIGKLLHLHPLTLEDILQQDPREKLEFFPKLGYYFIAFRAIESKRTRERFRSHDPLMRGETSPAHDEGIVGEVLIYLIVFREGVCSFHFTDMSEHTDRVRNRLLLLDETVSFANTSSDWIAHGIVDSVIDSFFPFLEEIEKEIAEIEDLVFSDRLQLAQPKEVPPATGTAQVDSASVPEMHASHSDDTHVTSEKLESASLMDEKQRDQRHWEKAKTRFSVPATSWLDVRHLRRIVRLKFRRVLWSKESKTQTTTVPATLTTLRRMAKTRRLVTTLTRLLASKSEVVAQIKKRMLTRGDGSMPNVSVSGGAPVGEEAEIAIYMGDVQDHIVTLQTSLVHYERMLSQLHPTYLSQLRISVSKTKSGSDRAIVLLSIVSIGVICCQPILGVCSMNTAVPTNHHELGYPYNVFGVVIALLVLILCGYGMVVRRWWVRSKRRRGAVL